METDLSYLAFKKLRNQLGKYDVISIVAEASKKLREIENQSFDKFDGWLPWYLLLLIRWGFEYGGAQYPRKSVDEKALSKLINLIHDLEGVNVNPFLKQRTITGVFKFLRTIAFQQFWLQGSMGRWDLARQNILFCKLTSDSPIQKRFIDLFGISMSDTLIMELLLWSWLIEEKNPILFSKSSIFGNTIYTASEVSSFINTISLPLNKVNYYLGTQKQAIRNPAFQLSEQTPFVRYPCLQIEDQLIIYSRRVFEQTINNLFYDVMKSEGGSEAAQLFATVIENYVDKALGYAFKEFLNESVLKKNFPDQKVTDFLLPLEECTVLIEVKSTELRPLVRVNPETNSMKKELKDSVIKAALQGFTLANNILRRSDGVSSTLNKNFYLLIITYCQMFLGPGERIWDEFLKDAIITTLAKENIDQKLIDPEKIIVLSIDEFDYLISVLLSKKVTLPKILEKMQINNTSLNTAKFNFAQHLDEYRSEKNKLPYLDESFNELMDRAQHKFL
jgi:hypothetical protein